MKKCMGDMHLISGVCTNFFLHFPKSTKLGKSAETLYTGKISFVLHTDVKYFWLGLLENGTYRKIWMNTASMSWEHSEITRLFSPDVQPLCTANRLWTELNSISKELEAGFSKMEIQKDFKVSHSHEENLSKESEIGRDKNKVSMLDFDARSVRTADSIGRLIVSDGHRQEIYLSSDF